MNSVDKLFNYERSMIMENTNENKGRFLLDYELLEKGIRKIKDFSVKDFAKFSAITAVCFSIAIWVTRSFGYFYTLGRFSVYHIDKSYIDVLTEGFFLQVIQTASTCIVILAINYMYFRLSIPHKGKNGKRILKKIGFVLLEFIALNAWILFTRKISLIGLLKELSFTLAIKIVAYIFVWFVVLFLLNAVGIEIAYFYKKSLKEKKVVNENEKEVEKKAVKKVKDEKKQQEMQNDEGSDIQQGGLKHQIWMKIISMLLVICIMQFIFLYIVGIVVERQRNEFKYVVEEVETVEGDEYLFTDQKKGVSYHLYPIVYENQDVYILSQIGKKEDGISVNYEFLRIIDKEEITTYYIDYFKIIN